MKQALGKKLLASVNCEATCVGRLPVLGDVREQTVNRECSVEIATVTVRPKRQLPRRKAESNSEMKGTCKTSGTYSVTVGDFFLSVTKPD